MVRKYSILKSSTFLICPVFFFCACTSSPGKTMHKSYHVDIKQMQFQPSELTVQKGDTIIWTNHDIVAHDITEEKNKKGANS